MSSNPGTDSQAFSKACRAVISGSISLGISDDPIIPSGPKITAFPVVDPTSHPPKYFFNIFFSTYQYKAIL
jgi:hypothetical protein